MRLSTSSGVTVVLLGTSLVASTPRSPSLASAAAIQSWTSREQAKNKQVKSIRIIQQTGARPRFSPGGDLLVFDRPNADGFYDVYLSDLRGNVVASLTDHKRGINQRNNGNARFHPSGAFIVFVSEEERHFGVVFKHLADPGVGLYSNLWATDPKGSRFWRLTDTPIKKRLADRVESMAVVNPLFSPDGSMLLWTERYAEGGHGKWGRWRIKAADFVVSGGNPSLRNERVLFTPKTGNYVTAMGFLDPGRLVVAGNLDGQHEFGMDQYVYGLKSRETVDLTNTPEVWEEDSSVAPNGQIVYMTNIDSKYKFNFNNPNWPSQPVEREYYTMNGDGSRKQRLTYFNDPSAPEYVGNRTLVAASDVSPDGRYIAGTMGVDHGTGDKRENVVLKVILIECSSPLK